MNPRCKVGDIAIIIDSARSKQDCLGRFVTVVGPAPARLQDGKEMIWEIIFHGDPPDSCWKPHHAAPDSYLKPIRGDKVVEKEDAMQSW